MSELRNKQFGHLRNPPQQQTHQDQLNQDYSTIAALLANLNEEAAKFSSKMEGILETVPALDGLMALWQEQSEMLAKEEDAEIKSAAQVPPKPTGNNKDSLLLMDDHVSEDPDDTVILL